LKPDDFRIAFAVVSVLVASSVLFHRRLDPKAGADVSGHAD
jgi:hypothetical protein